MRLDARIPVQVLAAGGEPEPSDDAVLLRVGTAPPAGNDPGWAAVRMVPDAAIAAHGSGCNCCSGRSGLAQTLGQMVIARARSELPWFRRIVLSVPQHLVFEAVAVLRDDALVSGRFRHEAEN